jgi:Pregnancy-associated plasma protein-A/Secretion system C-terminal sorting domain
MIRRKYFGWTSFALLLRVGALVLLALPTMQAHAQASCGQSSKGYIALRNTKIDSVPPAGRLYIPVVVHILWHTPAENIPDTQVLSQLEALNRDYQGKNEDIQHVPSEFAAVIGNVDVQFCLAAIDPQGQATNAIERKYTAQKEMGTTQDWHLSANGGLDAWDTSRYLNIWVVNTGQFVTGFASYPAQNLPYDGVVVHPAYFGIQDHPQYGLGRVATHEVGHYLGLTHPWGDDSNCTTDDGITDTPPQYGAHGGCPSYPASGCSASEMFMNFMDYVDDPCMLLFTQEQARKMRETLLFVRQFLSTNPASCLASTTPIQTMVPYPNPSGGNLQILFRQPPMRLVTYSLFNTAGQLIRQDDRVVNDRLDLDFTDLAPGIYFLRCEAAIARFVKF